MVGVRFSGIPSIDRLEITPGPKSCHSHGAVVELEKGQEVEGGDPLTKHSQGTFRLLSYQSKAGQQCPNQSPGQNKCSTITRHSLPISILHRKIKGKGKNPSSEFNITGDGKEKKKKRSSQKYSVFVLLLTSICSWKKKNCGKGLSNFQPEFLVHWSHYYNRFLSTNERILNHFSFSPSINSVHLLSSSQREKVRNPDWC